MPAVLLSSDCGLFALSPWHLKQISYSLVTCVRKALLLDCPFTPSSAPLASGGCATDALAMWELWQSAHSACRATPTLVSGSGFTAELGLSEASWAEGVSSTGCVYVLLRNSALMLRVVTVPSWHWKQTFSSIPFTSRCATAGAWGRWQLSQPLLLTPV